MTISFVRASTPLAKAKCCLLKAISGAASFTIYNRTKEYCLDHNYLCRDNIVDVALTGGLGGAMSGALISFGSARECRIFPSDLADLN